LLKVEKAPPPAVVIKSEKASVKEETGVPGLVAQDVMPPPSPLPEADVVKGEVPSVEQGNVKALPPPPLSDKEKTVKVPAATPKEKATETNLYVVQVTSCKNRKIAEDVVKEIGKIGFKASIMTVEIKNKGTWYRVLLSNLDGKDKANEAAQKIDRVLKGNKSVVRIQNR
jgi:cell division protein FtsN